MVMVNAHVPAAAQLPSVFGQARVESDLLRLREIGPQVDHLVKDSLILLRESTALLRPPYALALSGHCAVQGLPKRGDLPLRKEVVILNVTILLEKLDVGWINHNFGHLHLSCLI